MRQRDEAEAAVASLAAVAGRIRAISAAPPIQQAAAEIEYARRALYEYMRLTATLLELQAQQAPNALPAPGVAALANTFTPARWVYGNGIAVRLADVAAITSVDSGIHFFAANGALIVGMPFLDNQEQAAALERIYLAAGIGPTAITKG